MIDHTLAATMSERGAVGSPRRAALVLGDVEVSYADFHDRVLRCAAALRAEGIGAGDRVGYLGVNSIDYAVLLQAALRIGAVTVAINWRLAEREVAYVVADAEPALIVGEAARLAHLRAVPVVAVDGPLPGRPRFADWVAAHAPDAARAPARADDVAMQLYTSGTTGNPKGALLTYRNLAGAVSLGSTLGEDWAAWRDGEVALVAAPFFHIGGSGWLLQALHAGATVVIMPRADIGEIIAAIERRKVTTMFQVPAVLGMILDHPAAEKADLGSVRTLLYGASPIPPDTLRRAIALFPNAQFVQTYGATETTGAVVYLPPEDHDAAGTPRMAGCGKPMPQAAIRIVTPDGADLPPGSTGEVLIRSPLVAAGYHRLPEATAAAFRDGWYRSGDAGHLDADGYLYLSDRIKDMICSGAENIYPTEVENVLHEHPLVRDCAVIGVPDARWGEAVKAIIVPAPGAAIDPDELIAFARARIASYKLPRSIDFAAELPRNPSGKILKKELRKPYWPEEGRGIA